jgi:hypothetical protein
MEQGPMFNWEWRDDVPKNGRSFIAIESYKLFPNLHGDRRVVYFNAIVVFVGIPPNTYGIGGYKVIAAFGFEHLVGKIFGLNFNEVY